MAADAGSAEMVPTKVGILEPLQICGSGRAVPPGPSGGLANYMFIQWEAVRLEELRLAGGKTSHRPPPVQAAGSQSNLLPARPEYCICGLSGCSVQKRLPAHCVTNAH